MPVTIRQAPAKAIGNRRAGYERVVRGWAPDLVRLQAKGYISPAQIAGVLNSLGILTSKGKPFAESVIRGMLLRGKELGLGLQVRTVADAAAARPYKPRPPRAAKRSPKSPKLRGLTS